jgi:hypothetical protein
MGDSLEKGTLFRAEALDEFSSRTRGEVLRLPALNVRWIALLCVLWGASFILLLSFLPWHESLLIEGRVDSTADGRAAITFLVPAHIAQDSGDQLPDRLIDGAVKHQAVVPDGADLGLWLLRLFNNSERYRIVAWTVAFEDLNDPSVDTRHLRLSSSTLIDVLILKLANELHDGSEL